MNVENIETLDKAIWRYGIAAQLDMVIEEMSELTKEICKNKRGKENKEEIIEEIADVSIMLKQLQLIFDIKSVELDKKVLEKIERLKNRLEEKTHE